MATKNTSFLDDKDSMTAIVEGLPPATREEYKSYRSLSLEAVFPNRILVVYDLVDCRPENSELLKFGDLKVTRIDGPVMEVQRGGKTLEIGVLPVKLGEREIFLQAPQSFELKWKGKRTPEGGVNFIPHYAVLIKSRSREHLQVDRHTYCVTLNKYTERFPDSKIRY